MGQELISNELKSSITFYKENSNVPKPLTVPIAGNHGTII